jgi:peptidyl-prolyl cis-trans isomerase-like 4
VFAQVVEGLDVLKKVSQAFVDDGKRPYVNIRILKATVLVDDFPDPAGMPRRKSPARAVDRERLEYDELEKQMRQGRTESEVLEAVRKHKAKSQALALELLDDLPDAEAKTPGNMLFVCRLNPVTKERDLELIFSRFGLIKSVEVVRDWMTGQSLQYGFIQFETQEACHEAYLAMENAIIDDRRIHVDFGQSQGHGWRRNRGRGRPAERERPRAKEEVVPIRQEQDSYGLVWKRERSRGR